MDHAWPALPYEEWRDTRDTLHMYLQVIGKLRLALSPFEPEWANVPMYLSARGLTTSPMAVGDRSIDAEFDLIEHTLVLRASDGRIERRPLGGAVADFYADVMQALRRLDVDVAISVLPSEVPHPIPFPEDRTHSTYVAEQAARFFRVLSMIDAVLKQHRAGFRGRTTPVQFFWGTFDMALVRYSGRFVAPPEHAGIIARYGADAEEICAGWWPGDDRVPYAACYAYAFPKPDGIEARAIEPAGAAWNSDAGEFVLPYEAARSLPDPRRGLLDFFESTYSVAAGLMDWDPALTEINAPPATAVPSSVEED